MVWIDLKNFYTQIKYIHEGTFWGWIQVGAPPLEGYSKGLKLKKNEKMQISQKQVDQITWNCNHRCIITISNYGENLKKIGSYQVELWGFVWFTFQGLYLRNGEGSELETWLKGFLCIDLSSGTLKTKIRVGAANPPYPAIYPFLQ